MTARGEFPTSRSRSAFRIFRISIDSSGPASAFRHVTCAAPEAVPHDPCFASFAARAHTEELKHLAFAPSLRGRERELGIRSAFRQFRTWRTLREGATRSD